MINPRKIKRDGIIIFEYFDINGNSIERRISIDTNKIDKCIELMIEFNVNAVEVCDEFNFGDKDLSFLNQLPHFSYFYLNTNKSVLDITPLHEISSLEKINLTSKFSGVVDFSAFNLLEDIAIDCNNKYINLEKCSNGNKVLLIGGSKKKEFSEFHIPESVIELSLWQNNIKSISGTEKCSKIEILSFYRLSKLENITSIGSLTNLREIELKTCKVINDYDILGSLSNLKKIKIDKCATMQNLKFVKNLSKLDYFVFLETNVMDGDLSPLVEKKFYHLAFDDKKHFSHKYKDIGSKISK